MAVLRCSPRSGGGLISTFSTDGRAVIVQHGHERLRIEPWGEDSVRVRVSYGGAAVRDVGALDAAPSLGRAPTILIEHRHAVLVNGALTVEVRHAEPDAGGMTHPLIRFCNTFTGAELLAEQPQHIQWPGARVRYGNRRGSGEVQQQFRAYPAERLYGMGQRTHGYLNHKGLALDLVQRNTEVSVPFLVSSRGYGFLWNNPAVGRVEFAENVTRWTAKQSEAIDYWLTAGSARAALGRFADVTGHAPPLPAWASGLWQSKLRYTSQAELLAVVAEYRRREVPLAVIVTDYFHWTAMGDYRFDPQEYPDPASMMRELDASGVKLMVSIWPTVSPLSENYRAFVENGLLVGADQGLDFQASIQDKGMSTAQPVAFYDPTNPATREYVWAQIREHYRAVGVQMFWLDASEPEVAPGHHENLTFFAGPGAEVAGIYPRDNARLFAEGALHDRDAVARGESEDLVLLSRSAWAGQQKYGAAVWSGDIRPTWEAVQQQVRAGLSIAMAGIPWWTTDIGGFHGGDPASAEYRELLVRWFQFGAFCPIFRLHGYREPRVEIGWGGTGGPNELWSFGEDVFTVLRDYVEMRERLRPYIHRELTECSRTGVPMMRPLFVDYPDDEPAWQVEDEFLFGPDILVAPVLHPGQQTRTVYFPAGSGWVHVWTGAHHEGGSTARVEAPLEQIPLFIREGVSLPIRSAP